MSAYGTGSFAVSYSYDNENRLTVANASGATESVFGYDPSNQRVYQGTYGISSATYSNERIYFYGADGKKLVVYSLQSSGSNVTLTPTQTNTWFAGRLLVPQDRLRSVGKYFPYGEDRYSPTPANPANDQEKFATYTRDSATGLDYAYQRYYNDQLGRFMTIDPYASSALVRDPESWNRYTYAEDDSANHNDPTGLFCSAEEYACGEGFLDFGTGSGSSASSAAQKKQPAVPSATPSIETRWNALSSDCRAALQTALPAAPSVANTDYAISQWLNAYDAAQAARETITNALGNSGVPESWVAAIGVRETGFGTQQGGTVNIFQISLQNLSAASASNLSVASQWVAKTLSHNVSVLKSDGVSGNALMVDLFASYNQGLSAVLKNLNDADAITTRNYGSNVANLVKCF